MIPNWSVSKIKRTGADGAKLLARYRTDAGGEVLTHQKNFVRQISEECIRYDIPFPLELIVYPFPDEKGELLKKKNLNGGWKA